MTNLNQHNGFKRSLITKLNHITGAALIVWASLRTAFQTDFKSVPTVSSIVRKTPDIKQSGN